MSTQPIFYIKRLSSKAIIPTKGSAGAAGYDLYSAMDTVVPARGKALVATDLAITVPYGCYGRIAPRSGLAWKHSIDVGAGVVDHDFLGMVGIVLFNHSDVPFPITTGDRVAQLILERIEPDALIQEVSELTETARGAGSFGSTGR